MLTWDDEVTSQIRRVVETAHCPELPFTIMQIKPDEEGELECKTYHCTYSEHVARMKADGLELYEAYFALCASNDQSMRVGNHTESWAVAVDFDHGLPDLCLPGQPLAPTIVIATSGGRYHCIWQLTETIPAHRMGRLGKVMAKRLGGDMAFARVNQMVRLPRFRNRKYGTVVLLREDLCSGAEYSPDFLWKACDGALYEAGIAISSPQINHIHPHVLRDSPDITLKHTRAAVDHLKNRRYAENYATWFKVLVNLAALGHEGRLIALAFSEGSPKFDADAFEKKWASVCKSGNGALSTLFAMAQKEGWKNPGWSDSDGGGEPARAITDREFGALAANEMAETVVALDGEPGARGMTTQFYAWDGMTNRSLTPRQKRAYVATAAAAVIKRGRQAGGEASWTAHEKKLGSNKLLEEVCEHVSEALVPLSEPRIVSGAPYLPVANGVVNLLTRQLVPSDYRAIAKTSAPVSFDPSAQADRFLRFLNEVLQDDKAMIAYLLRVLGYALLGDPREQVMFILLGPSGNGKSTLMEVMLALLGPLAGRLRTETLMQKSHVNDGANPGLAKLKGARILVIAEPNRTHKLDTSLVKQLTGEKKIFVRGLYSGGEEITIESCLFMTANFMPYAEAQDKALWRRIRVIPFERTFSPDQINRNLTEELKAEGSGILNLLLSGLADYMSQGLNPPEKVVQAVGALQQAADAFEVFVQECCTLDHMQRIELKVLWAAYQDWAKVNNKFRVLTKAEVTERLQERFERVTRGNLPVFVGLTLAGA